ncbi:MAG TPA: sulfotransferase [Alphaproteobacteria bacterium]|nr:sulfotransferase [Alphaproteobacteria bacterium]
MSTTTPPLEFDALIAEARRRTGLSDFGSEWIFEPMQVLLDSIHREARLSDTGKMLQAETILNSLTSRLKTVEAVKRNPEILEEEVNVAATIVALHRTGSTLTHRLLSSAPSMTAIAWWECQFWVPFEGEERGKPVARRAAAQEKLDLWLKSMPDLMSIHPMSLDQPDEETTLLEASFVGLSPESFLWVPSYAEWSAKADFAPAYEDLRLILKYLQWQDPARAGKSWVLKTPSHLPAPEALANAFPESLIVMTHRDPLKTTPSFASMTYTLHTFQSNEVDPVRLGNHWAKRISKLMDRLLDARERIGEHRFVDLKYEELVKAPLDAARLVYQRMGRDMTAEDEAAMRAWMAANGRDNRPSHQYSLEQYGLSAEQLAQDFKRYRERFILPA